jgi:trimeric autotransporter adhesin
MKIFYASLACLLLCSMSCLAQNVAINEDGSLPDASAILDIKSHNKGVLIPRMSTADRLSITGTGAKGLLVYDTTTSSFWYRPEKDAATSGFWKNLATGDAWSLWGNHADSTNFLGTTNNVPLKIRVNNQPSGGIDPARQNAYWGYQAGYVNAITGDTAGYGNTASGYRSLYSNTMGNYNTATGTYSLNSNTLGGFNTANGLLSLQANTTGSYNTAFGYRSLYNNSTGTFNTAIGSNALVSTGNLTNATAIGFGAIVNASNKVRIGNASVTVIEGQVPFTTPSDGRFKFQVKEDVKGLDFILQLRPVTYQFDVKRFDAQYSQAETGNESSNGNYALQASYDEAARIRRSGFIAQEVEKAAMASGYNFSGIIQPKTAKEHYSLSYESFVVPLVKAVQELSNEVETLKKENKKIADLQQQLDDIKRLLQGAK